MYNANRDSNCSTPVGWTVDNNYATIVQNTDSSVVLKFLKNGSFYLYASMTSCSSIKDSILITAYNQTSSLNLGNDTSFCLGDSLTLNAGTGFLSYLWSNGSNASQITVNQKGIYWVAATNSNGCISHDTIAIKNVYPLPNINFGPDTVICKGGDVVFNAGSNFVSYVWQDGSQNPSYTANQLGTYWVRVVDKNNCVNTDTVKIRAIVNPPANFLIDTATLCLGYSLSLTAIGTWQSYLWSNGSTNPTTNITVPGIYWLEVKDKNGCSATDSISVVGKSNCIFDIFFPNAFTPNGDGINDFFKPIVYGGLDEFQMVIFNRWGQKVFETSNPNIGWDGTLNGKKQDPNTYVWYATYHLVGSASPVKKAKGVLILVR